jgi:hypothetical protein
MASEIVVSEIPFNKEDEEFYVHFGGFKKIERCSELGLHNFKNMDARTKCEWCGKTVGEVGAGL